MLLHKTARNTRSCLACIALLCAAGCGSTSLNVTATTGSENLTRKLLTIKQSGGCVRIGPNCAVHTLFSDGLVHANRNDAGAAEEPEVIGFIDAGDVQGWQAVADAQDFALLLENLPAGRCAGCVDGVDYEYTVYQPDATVSFSSIDYKFDSSYTFFTITLDIYRAMSDAASLELRQY